MVEKTHQEPLITMHSLFGVTKNNSEERDLFHILGRDKYKNLFNDVEDNFKLNFELKRTEQVDLIKVYTPVANPLKFYDWLFPQDRVDEIYNTVLKTIDMPLWKAIDTYLKSLDKSEGDYSQIDDEVRVEEENGSQFIHNIMGHMIKGWVEVFLLIRFAEETGYMFAFDDYFKLYGRRKMLLQYYKWIHNQNRAIWGSDRRKNLFIKHFAQKKLIHFDVNSGTIIDGNKPIAEQHAMISAWILEDVHIQDLGSKITYDTYVKWASMFAKISLLIAHKHYDYEFHDNYFFHTKTKEKLKTKRELLLITFKECFPEVNDKDLRRYALEHGKRKNDKYQNLSGRADKRTDM